VADLEAELDDPSTGGDWEEIETDDAPVPATTTAPEALAASPEHPERGANSSEAVEGSREAGREDAGHRRDLEIAEASDDSDVAQAVHQTTESIGYMQLNEPPAETHAAGSSSATTPPVDIIARKPVGTVASVAQRLVQPDARIDRQMTRTPSPNGMGSLDVTVGVEGPMTPRNDAGPFIFDGSAGRAADAGARLTSTLNLGAAADPSLPEATPQ
jgi:hypothetical protein